MLRRPPRSALFPYPTYCRSDGIGHVGIYRQYIGWNVELAHGVDGLWPLGVGCPVGCAHLSVLTAYVDGMAVNHLLRSEEHTSELQSRQYPGCRLLLEKKKLR